MVVRCSDRHGLPAPRPRSGHHRGHVVHARHRRGLPARHRVRATHLARQAVDVRRRPTRSRRVSTGIEQAVEAIAIEIERVAEGQRFVTKVLAERPAQAQVHVAAESPLARDAASSALGEAKPFLALGAGPIEPIRVGRTSSGATIDNAPLNGSRFDPPSSWPRCGAKKRGTTISADVRRLTQMETG